MSVYTKVSRPELVEFLKNYSLGHLVWYRGIDAGIENTNYFVTTDNGEWVLTLFENINPEILPVYLQLMAHLADHGLPIAHPIADLNGDYLRILNNKPTAIVRRLDGKNHFQPDIRHCAAIGHTLGQIHIVGQSFTQHLPNARDLAWCIATAHKVHDQLPVDERILLDEELKLQQDNLSLMLPSGIIHADLFRDNAMFIDHALTGIIDFYYACTERLLYDVAITVNDWCTMDNGEVDAKRVQSLLDAYKEERSFEDSEYRAWPIMLRAAALRFWLSRLHDKFFPKMGEITHIKDPAFFKNILLAHRKSPVGL